MKLKHLSAAVLLGAALSTPAIAHEFTIGVGLLSTTLDSEFEQTISGNSNKSYSNASSTDLGGEIFLGYVWTINKGFDMAFELFYDWNTTETKDGLSSQNAGGFTGTGHAKHKINGVWGVRVLPGFYVTTNTKIFLDVGYANIDNELSLKSLGTTGFSKQSDSRNAAAYRYGAGVQTMIYENFSLRASYVVMDGASNVRVKSDNGANSVKATPTIHNFAADLTYHFNI
jgi:opacity protein-like surface antigen